MATTEAPQHAKHALLKVDGFVDALNEEGKEFEAILGDTVEEHSYAGEPMARFGEWLAVNRPGANLSFAADKDGALFVIINF
jgi:hypothetical protein